MTVHTTTRLDPLTSSNLEANYLAKAAGAGLIEKSELMDDGTVLSYKGHAVLDNRNLNQEDFLPKQSGSQLTPSKLKDDGTVLSYNGNEVHDTRFKRKKTEVYYSGVSVPLSDGVAQNLVTLLKALTPTSGTLAPFFDTVGNKLRVINDDATLFFKLNLTGNWTGGSTARHLRLDFAGTNGNSIVANRTQITTGDTISLHTFLSVDKNGNLATNGSVINLTTVGTNFTITSALLVVEQITKENF